MNPCLPRGAAEKSPSPNFDPSAQALPPVEAACVIHDIAKIVVVRCRGVQIDNSFEVDSDVPPSAQDNLFLYEIDCSEINFDQILADRDVQRTLMELAAAPDDDKCRQQAARQLQRRSQRARPLQPLDRVKKTSSTQFSHRHYPDGLDRSIIIIKRSQGVQIGEGCMQYNTFVYTLSPRIDAFSLLAEDPSLIDYILKGATGEVAESIPEFGEQMADAVQVAGHRAGVSRPDRGVSLALPRAGRVLRVKGLDGVSIGRAFQVNETAVTADNVDTGVRTFVKRIDREVQGAVAVEKARQAVRRLRQERDRLGTAPSTGAAQDIPLEDLHQLNALATENEAISPRRNKMM